MGAKKGFFCVQMMKNTDNDRADKPRRTVGSAPVKPSAGATGRRRGGKPMQAKRRIGAVVALAALAAVAAAGGFVWNKVGNISGGAGAGSIIGSLRNPRQQFPDKRRVNILLAGIDYSYLQVKGNPKLNGMPYTKDSRSDTVMVLSLDLDTQKVSALSIPRDTWVTAPDGKTGKLNATYRRGGTKLLGATVAQITGVPPDYYMVIKPSSVKTIVDKLGGVEVETVDAMEYNDSQARLHISLPKGRQVINGDQAIGFARFREADLFERQPDGQPIYLGYKDSSGEPAFKRRTTLVHSKEEGDDHRTARQQQLMRAMATKGKSFTNLLNLDDIVNTALGEVQTNMSRPQIFALVALFRNIQPGEMQGGTLPGHGVREGTYKFVLDERKTQAMVDWLLKGDEAAANRVTVVSVQNGTAIPGAASRLAAKLREQGYDAKSEGNVAAPHPASDPATAPAELPATRITYNKAAVASRAQRIAQMLGIPAGQVSKSVPLAPSAAPAVPTDDDRADVTVLLGRDLAPAYGPVRSAKR